jgi:hypothetical protein
VVREHAVRELGIEGCERCKHFGAALGMYRDGASLFGRERGCIVNDVEEGFVDLADIMEERDAFDGTSLVIIEVRGFGNDERVGCDAANVRSRLRVIRVDGVEQRFQGGGSESFRRGTAPSLVNEHGAGEDSSCDRDGDAHGLVLRKKRTSCGVRVARARCWWGGGGKSERLT